MVNCLYIHIPFCIKKCIYCDFYSVPFPRREVVRDYINAIHKEISLKKLNAELRSIYIGGGTPTILSGDDVSKIMNAIKNEYHVNPDAEISIEANPCTITEEKAEMLLKSGINRISIGVQSFFDNELEMLGRGHSSEDAIKAVIAAKRAGFKNISIDLIYGMPSYKYHAIDKKSEFQKWEYSLKTTLAMSPEHISVYELTPEKNTPLYEDIKSGRIVMPDEEAVSEMYYAALDIIKRHGYIHYEISNFAKSGYECIHNLNYWNRGEYIGIGAGAFSFFNGKRFSNVRDLSRYIESLNKAIIPVDDEIEITEKEAVREFVFLGLRKTGGIDLCLLPVDRQGLFDNTIKGLISQGLVEIKDNHLRLTEKGLVLSNEVILQILLCIE